jgi:hypothetical protein
LVSEHAVRQYRERVKPALDLDGARADLERVIGAGGEIASSPPRWLDSAHPEALFLVVGGSVALPVARSERGEPVAVSCLVDSSISTYERGERTERRRRRQHTRRVKKG